MIDLRFAVAAFSAVNALLVLALVGCRAGARAGGVARAEAPPTHIDSVAPRDVAMARFREGLINPGHLDGGARSRDRLVRHYVAALERRDTSGLVGLTITRAEFAYLYYPTAPEASPPYDLEPGLAWFVMQGNSGKGLSRALADRGGRSLGYLDYLCDDPPTRQGANRVWGACLVRRLRASGDTVEERLFGPIVERDGVFKFLSLANRL